MSLFNKAAPQRQEPPIAVLLGLPFHDLTLEEALEECRLALRQKKPGYFVTANVDFAAQAYRSPALRVIFFYADRIFCDGMPLVWISRLLGHPLRERVAGADLVPRLLEICAREGKRVYFFGSDEKTLAEVVTILGERHPKLVVCGYESPPMGAVESWDNLAVIERIRQSEADLLLLALGCPKQEEWIHRFHDQTGAALSIGIGASLDFISGKQTRAPQWMQKTGLEWFWRMSTNPRRLLGRYSRDFFFLGGAALAQAWSLRHRPTAPKHKKKALQSGPHLYDTLRWEGSVERSTIDQLTVPTELKAPLLLDCSQVDFIDSAGLGVLAGLARKARESGKAFALLQPSAAVCKALKAVRMDTLIVTLYTAGSFEQMMQSSSPTLKTERNGQVLKLKLTGSLEGAGLEGARRRIEQSLRDNPEAQKLVLDMGEVDFLDSRGVGVLLSIRRGLYHHGGELFLANLRPEVKELLTLLKLDTVLPSEQPGEVRD